MHLKLAIFTHVNGQCGHHYQHKILIYDLQNILWNQTRFLWRQTFLISFSALKTHHALKAIEAI